MRSLRVIFASSDFSMYFSAMCFSAMCFPAHMFPQNKPCGAISMKIGE
jgi:hypothetical protein